MTTDFVYGEFIMLSDDSFVSFSVKDDQAEIRPPLDSLNINVSLHLNVNITVKQAVQTAALGAAVAFTWFGIPPSALAQTKELASSQQSQIAYMGNTEVPIKSMHSAPISTHSENCSISDVAAIEKVDSTSTNSSEEKSSLVQKILKKGKFVHYSNFDFLLVSRGPEQQQAQQHDPAPNGVHNYLLAEMLRILNRTLPTAPLNKSFVTGFRVQQSTGIPHTSIIAQANFLDMDIRPTTDQVVWVKDRFLVGGSVDLMGVMGIQKIDSPLLVEVSAQTSFPQLGRNNRIGINIGWEI